MGRKIAAVIAVVLQVLVLVFMYVPAGLVVPAPAWLVLNAIGLGFALVCLRQVRRGSPKSLAVPVVSALFWFAFVSAGSVIFGWTA